MNNLVLPYIINKIIKMITDKETNYLCSSLGLNYKLI